MALGVYVHLPFCPYICPYCDFAKWPLRRSAAARYLEALYAEIDREPATPAATFFLGGGTPNTYLASDIAALVARLRDRFGASAAQEISIELNPELVRPGDMLAYADAGINRVSIGVQSFVEPEIATLGRKHSYADVERAVTQARAAAIASVSIDLIFGVPGQTQASWQRSLDAAIALGVDHVSTYGLTVEEGTPYFAWQAREPRAFAAQDDEAEMYDLAIRTLEAAGFEHYEISNFARPGHRCAHNANYWENGPYVGLGVGAASYRDGRRSTHTRDLAEYLDAAGTGRPIPGNAEHLLGDAAAGEAVMLALRTSQGVGLRSFKERYHLDVLERFAQTVANFVEAGMLEVSGDSLRLTRQGRFIANDVCGAFLSLD
ncbi:MAG TPA: radical SAM family heme chaperone HemW [Candidatus Baltobacteraceae bacterium]|nr:radical SAM family heme chaperone HemW [Candidatus Baltobacteraceae bacterium]